MVQLTNMFSRTALLALAALSTVVKADLKITSPSSSVWWVAKSQNVLEWTCNDSQFLNFTVLVSNTNTSLQASPLAIIAIQQNYVCSLLVTQDQANQPAGTGWQILFANPLNNTQVYASSEPFEIKPLGSAYPSQTTPSANASSGSASSTGSAAGTKPTSAASSISTKGVTLSLAAGALVAAVGLVL